MSTNSLTEEIRQLLSEAGPSKEMGVASPSADLPHFYLARRFLHDVDLLILFNTRRCRYNCHFCDLPAKSVGTDATAANLEQQFRHVINETKHALSVVSRFTISNEGSVFDEPTFDPAALLAITEAAAALPAVRSIAYETRLEFVTAERIDELRTVSRNKRIDIMTGFETLDEHLRDEVLFKREPLDGFMNGLDLMAKLGLSLTTYVLFKPHYAMTDEEAMIEARSSIEFLHRETSKRQIPLLVRLNPMYAATQTRWADEAILFPTYRPPRLTDVLSVAKEARANGVNVYLGLSAEGLAEDGRTYRAREDFDKGLLKEAILFNEG